MQANEFINHETFARSPDQSEAVLANEMPRALKLTETRDIPRRSSKSLPAENPGTPNNHFGWGQVSWFAAAGTLQAADGPKTPGIEMQTARDGLGAMQFARM
jgi:hypothetical protein